MLNSISWTDFLVALAILAGAYYLVVVLVFYRREIVDLIRNGSRLRGRERSSGTDLAQKPSPLMGVAVDDDESQESSNVTRETSEALAYAANDELPEEVGVSYRPDEMLVGTVSDLLEEIKTICTAIIDSSADKNEATTLFETLLSNYQQLKGTPYEKSISDYIFSVTRDPFPHSLSREEIEAFWNERA